jgi:hypothetical protein
MQTFLPYSSFEESAKSLDRMRLGKQRVECKQLLQALQTGPVVITVTGQKKTPWYNHPATKMWAGYEGALIDYAIQVCLEWRSRGYKDSLLPFFQSQRVNYITNSPRWLGDESFHNSHKSNLLRKNSEHYSKNNWNVPSDLPYIWPTE